MKKKIWTLLIFAFVAVAVFGFPKKKPTTEPKTQEVVDDDSSEPGSGMALSAASSDLSVVLKHRKKKPIIKTKVFLPLSGASAKQGNALRNALLLAQKDMRYQNTKYNYLFEVENSENIDVAYQNTDKPDVIISFDREAGIFVAPLAEKDKIIHVNFGSEDRSVAKGKYNFMNWTMPEETVERLIDFYQEQNWKNVVFIGEHTEEFDALETEFQKQAAQTDIQITPIWQSSTEQDFSTILQQAKELKTDAFLILLKKDSLEPFIEQYQKSEMTTPLTTIQTSVEALKLPEGACYADIAQHMDVFYNRVKGDYPDTNSEYALGTMYDTVMLLVQTFENAETPDKAVDVLAATEEYDGVIGVIVQNSEGIFDSRAVLKCINNGNPEVMFDSKAKHEHHHFDKN